MNYRNLLICLLALATTVTTSSLVTGCSSKGAYASRGSVYHGVGFRGYYHYPWGRRPIYIGGGGGGIGGGGAGEVDPDWGVEPPGEPIAVPLPEMGLPDFGGGMDAGGMDMGGFDW